MNKTTTKKNKKEPNLRRRSNGLWEARKQVNGNSVRVSGFDKEQVLAEFDKKVQEAENPILISSDITVNAFRNRWFNTFKVPKIKATSVAGNEGSFSVIVKKYEHIANYTLNLHQTEGQNAGHARI